MKLSIKIITGTVLIFLMIVSCEKDRLNKDMPLKIRGNDVSLIHLVTQENCGDVLTSDLMVGKNTRAGSVKITTDGNTLEVTFEAEEGMWLFSETHLSVTSSLDDVPKGRDGNPKIGLFEYSGSHDPYKGSVTYSGIPIDGSKELYILAHAVMQKVIGWETNLGALDLDLPDVVNISVSYPSVGSSSYFLTTVTNGGILDGTYEGWCVDVENAIYLNTEYVAEVISSYDPLFDSLDVVARPENMEKINWIVNQGFVGNESLDGSLFTFGDVQRAIWELIDTEVSTSGLGPWSQTRVDEILMIAESVGQYSPVCGEVVAIVLRPVDSQGNPLNVQVTITPITILVYQTTCIPIIGYEETAWAAGYDFGGKNWAKYFKYCVSD